MGDVRVVVQADTTQRKQISVMAALSIAMQHCEQCLLLFDLV